MSIYNIIASTDENTVVSEYIPEKARSDSYQSEADLEREFISLLTEQGYEYIKIHDEQALIDNIRKQLESVNDYKFSDDEWQKFFKEKVAGNNEGIIERTRKIQDDYIQVLERDDGSSKNIRLIDKTNIHNNRMQVINQYEESEGRHETRYDVTILVNGLPLIHIELKRRGVSIKEAFNQVNRYRRDSFWAANGLYEYVQVFVISNGTHTKYYSNTTRNSHIQDMYGSTRKNKKTSNSFEFTSFWADAKNKIIPDLIDFTKTFFAKHTILNILTKYCVFTSEDLLLVMRPYQIAATEKIINRIEIANNYKQMGTVKAGGYVWHTTGSGKTLTSFKTAQNASDLEYVDKVLFVVDRKDLDYQTMKEYDRFEKGAANSNTSTRILKRQLENRNERGGYQEYDIIITTIQKLDNFITKNKGHDIAKEHIVIIFDECHRSQFGKMHKKITGFFKKYHLFGFTGTPIFPSNAPGGGDPRIRTTEQAFGDKLHTYTIVDAINDNNVLPFRIDYNNTIIEKKNIKDEKVRAIDIEKAMNAPERISKITEYIIEHFGRKTKREERSYSFSSITNVKELASTKTRATVDEIRQKVRIKGFNSIFAVSSIETAKLYYLEFAKQMEALSGNNLRVALIYSYGANEDLEDILEDENPEDADKLDKSSRDFLDEAIKDYNGMFGTSYDTSSDKFQNYYKDVSLRMKNREIDILIVVNMFLTGFDATTLNTLWVDKNLRQHGLLQAYSRTNRILNSVKTFGNIVCFRDLEQATDDAIALFGNKDAGGIILLKSYDDYYYGYDEDGEHHPGYVELIEKMKTEYLLGERIIGEQNQKEFIRLFGAVLRLLNILSSFDQFEPDKDLSERDFQDYKSVYQDLYEEFRGEKGDKENINDDIEFEIELVKQIDVNIDYILMLVEKYKDSKCEDKEILINIQKAVNSSMQLRSKKELIENFIERVNVDSDVDKDWRKFVIEQKEHDLDTIINEENLKPEEAKKFIDNAFRDGVLKTTGTDIDKVMPPTSRFGGGHREELKRELIDKLSAFFEKYFGLNIVESEDEEFIYDEDLTFVHDLPKVAVNIVEYDDNMKNS